MKKTDAKITRITGGKRGDVFVDISAKNESTMETIIAGMKNNYGEGCWTDSNESNYPEVCQWVVSSSELNDFKYQFKKIKNN